MAACHGGWRVQAGNFHSSQYHSPDFVCLHIRSNVLQSSRVSGTPSGLRSDAFIRRVSGLQMKGKPVKAKIIIAAAVVFGSVATATAQSQKTPSSTEPAILSGAGVSVPTTPPTSEPSVGPVMIMEPWQADLAKKKLGYTFPTTAPTSGSFSLPSAPPPPGDHSILSDVERRIERDAQRKDAPAPMWIATPTGPMPAAQRNGPLSTGAMIFNAVFLTICGMLLLGGIVFFLVNRKRKLIHNG